jgi:hypothetical protein
MESTGEHHKPLIYIHKYSYVRPQTKLILNHIVTADGMSSVATGGTGTNGKQGGVPFLDNSSDDDTGNHKQNNLFDRNV